MKLYHGIALPVFIVLYLFTGESLIYFWLIF